MRISDNVLPSGRQEMGFPHRCRLLILGVDQHRVPAGVQWVVGDPDLLQALASSWGVGCGTVLLWTSPEHSAGSGECRPGRGVFRLWRFCNEAVVWPRPASFPL